MRKNVKKLLKTNEKTQVLGELFRHFTSYGWVFESIKLVECNNMMTTEEQ